MKKSLLEQFYSIENQLSPENLTCDGELPKAEVNRRFKSLSAQRAKLIEQLGYEPSFEELYRR